MPRSCRTSKIVHVRALSALSIALVIVASGAGTAAQSGSSSTQADRGAIERATQEYAQAWLANDASRVMATLTKDAVIFPSTLRPIAGAEAIRQFWFPSSGPSTRVTDMQLTIDDISVDGNTAIVSGSGTLSFTMTSADGQDSSRTLRSWFVNVLRRQSDGRWLIWRRMWGDVRS